MLFPRRKWKDIEGYEGLYQVSNLGEVRSLNYGRTSRAKKLKLKKNNDGYLGVQLHKYTKHKDYLVHRLVAQAFIPNPNNYPIINHKDENKTNNIWTNLEWCTHKYNSNYGTCIERRIISRKGKTRKGKRLQMIDKETGEVIRVFDSIADANEYLGRSRTNNNISMCAKGKYKTSGLYIWRYIINN